MPVGNHCVRPRLTCSDSIPAVTGQDVSNGQGTTGEPRAPDVLDDHRLTAFGLLHETHTGTLAALAPSLESYGFTLSTFEVLLRLARAPERRLRMSELTAQCTLTSSGLTRVVDRLESAGHVVRESCASDRRGFFAVLTSQGLERVRGALPAHLSTVDACFSALDADEMALFLAMLRKLRAVVRPENDSALSLMLD